MRLVFCGTPVDAVPALQALHAAGHEIALVVTQPDRRRRRGTVSEPSPVRVAAEALDLPVRTPVKAVEIIEEVRAVGADLGVVVAFGQLLPPALLEAVPRGFVNVHFSLLPRWRGAAPVERAMLADDSETGVCIMALEAGLDTGPTYAYERTPIRETETAGELRERLVGIGSELLVRVLDDIGERTPIPQSGEPTYAEKLTVDEFRLDPQQRAAQLARLVRAGNPRPGAWLMVGGRRVKVWRAHAVADDRSVPTGSIVRPGELVTVDGRLALDEVQAEGGRRLSGDAWMNGLHGVGRSVDA